LNFNQIVCQCFKFHIVSLLFVLTVVTLVRYFERQLHRSEEVSACFNGWFFAVLRFPLVDLRSGWKWTVGSASFRFLYCVLCFIMPLFVDLHLLYDTMVQFSLLSDRMGTHWLEYVIGIAGKVEWNTCVLSVTTSLGIFWNSGSKTM
jgi:hypothetical protein